MTRRLILTFAIGCCAAQGSDWLTDGKDPQRTNWQKDERIFTTGNAKDIRLLWKIQLDNKPREMHSLLPTLIADKVTTVAGPGQIAIATGASDNIYAIDVEKGQVVWQRHFEFSHKDPVRRGNVVCPGGLTATPVIGPGEAPGKYTLYVASWDGLLHRLNVADGEDLVAPTTFMPPNGKPYGLNLFNGVIYTHTAQGCGGNPNMVYAFDLATGKVGTWGPAGGGMWGRSGPAISSSGVMYTGTGDGRWDPENGVFGNGIIGVKQDPATKALKLDDYYGPSNAEWLVKRDLDMRSEERRVGK